MHFGEEARSFFGYGLRLRWRGAGEAGGSVGQPLWRERTTAYDLVRSGINAGQGRCCGCCRESSGDELTKRAVVVLVDARALRRPMRLGVRPDRRGSDGSRSGCINDADDARQNRLGEGTDEYPTANSSRKL